MYAICHGLVATEMFFCRRCLISSFARSLAQLRENSANQLILDCGGNIFFFCFTPQQKQLRRVFFVCFFLLGIWDLGKEAEFRQTGGICGTLVTLATVTKETDKMAAGLRLDSHRQMRQDVTGGYWRERIDAVDVVLALVALGRR
jgi:hypothetical protein